MYQNGQQNPIQSRVEFERLNREYLNVRRYLNPVGESLNRVKNNTIRIEKSKESPPGLNKNGNTFQEFAPHYQEKEKEVNGTLNKIWQEALLSTSSIKPQQQQLPYSRSPKQMQKPQMQRIPSRNQYMNFRNSQTPTTRAVKLAAQAQAASSQPHKQHASNGVSH
ncbi:hypothetical protein CANTEDRAFT_114855 [Yamadazyma tenuis ATCC 10573]|uniref:Uncharacterized protein n=2 Tax=Candida tenuis TaxID=2315449 RepID=G3BA77_CANTC|nr:uncharacterized protein CANTEDRAFT_114855 [Yamadazyma tenuis ATCC 10573]EGV61377.1 hypothetical protein CANTEDRAFT_114855 [Yamadazyma tenuis ATCC 10573]